MNIATSFIALSKRHLLAIFFALLTGLIIVAPQLVFIAHEGGHYKGLYMMMDTEAEWYYLARMHEVYDEGKIGNPYLLEQKFEGPIVVSPGGETILAIPGKLLNISIPTLNLIYKFLLPAITFLLLYAFIFRLTTSSPWSIAGGLFFLVGSTWLYADNLSHLLRGELWWTQFVYNRPVHPQFDGIMLFLYFNVLLSALKSRDARWFIALAALLGLSFYTYFYTFTFFLALNFVLVLLWIVFEKKDKKKEASYLSLATLGGFLIGIPALLAIYETMKHPDYAQITAFITVFTHHPEISKNGLVVSFLFGIYLFRTKVYRTVGIVRDHVILIVGFLITTFVVVNQQVLTGRDLYSGHYHHNFNIPIFIIVLMFLASAVISRLTLSRSAVSQPHNDLEPLKVQSSVLIYSGARSNFTIILCTLPWIASIVFIATGIFIQYASYVNDAPHTSEDQRYMPALSWLDAQTPKESVVMANETLSELIPVFTSDNVMWSIGATNYLMPLERTYFTPENLLRSNDFFHDIKQYRVDYILWDRKTDPGWNIDRFQLPAQFSSGDLVIYKLPQ